MIEIKVERPQHAGDIEHLLDTVFGEDRHEKAVYKLREGIAPIDSLCHVALVDGDLLGVIRYWPVKIHDSAQDLGHELVLLGPLAVDPIFQGVGIGRALVEHSLAMAEQWGYRAAVLVGDPVYYRRFQFDRSGASGLVLPGEKDQERVLLREIVQGASTNLIGKLLPALK